MTALSAMVAEPADRTLARAAAALAPAGLAEHVKKMAPKMPNGFWGRVVYDFQDGRFTLATLEERIKP